MNTTYAGPFGNCAANGIIELPDAEAIDLIKGGYGVAVNLVEVARAEPEIETAAATPQIERAAKRAK